VVINKVKHILVIRLSAMGDVAMTVPVLLALKKTYPHLKITVLTKAFLKPIFEELPNINVHIADVQGTHKGIIGLYRLSRELQQIGIDAVADVHNVLRSKILKIFFSSRNIPVFQIDKGRAEKKRLINLKGSKITPLKTSYQRYADVFEKLGYPVKLNSEHTLSKKKMSKEFQSIVSATNKRVIGVAPFAAFEGKTYPTELMEQVIQSLDSTKAYTVLLFGGGKKEELVLKSWEDKYDSCVNLALSLIHISEPTRPY